MPRVCSPLVYITLKWISQSVRALVVTCHRMALFYFILFFSPKPGAGSAHALGRGRPVWRWMRYLWSLATLPIPRSLDGLMYTVYSIVYSLLAQAVFPHTIPRPLPLRAATTVFTTMPAAHTTSMAGFLSLRGNEHSAAITSASFLGWLVSTLLGWSPYW